MDIPNTFKALVKSDVVNDLFDHVADGINEGVETFQYQPYFIPGAGVEADGQVASAELVDDLEAALHPVLEQHENDHLQRRR